MNAWNGTSNPHNNQNTPDARPIPLLIVADPQRAQGFYASFLGDARFRVLATATSPDDIHTKLAMESEAVVVEATVFNGPEEFVTIFGTCQAATFVLLPADVAPSVSDALRSTPCVRDVIAGEEAVILLSLGLPVWENLLAIIHLASGGIPALLLMIFGFPVVPAMGGGVLCYVLMDSYLNSRWRKMRVEIESELPTFVSRLAGTLLVTESPIRAISEVTETLSSESPLNAWLQRMLSGTRMEGRQFFEQARNEAAIISPSLALVVFQMGRFFETGGAGFTKAFSTTAEELSDILEARAIAGSKAESARQAVLMMLGIMGVIMMLMFSSPNIRQGFQNVTVQVITATAMAAMALGYTILNGMIDEALEG